MAELIIHRGNRNICLPQSSDTRYLYRIGSGNIRCGDVINLNDDSKLNALAETTRDEYSSWIYSLNEAAFPGKFISKDLSLFFLSDLSCKRSEFFDTYDSICNLLLIKNLMLGVELSGAWLIGVDHGFVSAFRSIFPGAVIRTKNLRRSRFTWWKRFGADFLYLFRLAGSVVINCLDIVEKRVDDRIPRRFFFSVYPQMFSANEQDNKYGSFVSDSDRYAVSILTDGMHQKVSLFQYYGLRKKGTQDGLFLVDEFIRITDFFVGWHWLVRCRWVLFLQRRRRFLFREIDITELIRPEFHYSLSRITRLCALSGSFRRFFKAVNIRELVYYLHEYPLGRMISYLLKTTRPEVMRTGFQMSPVSWRRLEQFLAVGEASRKSPFLVHAPIPDRVLAEDADSATIYRYSGYCNVEVMREIYRYAYLKSVIPERREGWALLVPGLHDGELMLECLRGEISENLQKTYLLKPHPRADNAYLSDCEKSLNIQVSYRPLHELLGVVKEVFVTYSSAGIEAKKVGLEVTIVNVPGKINTSPLLNR